ncbi:metalloregulator ArsR/SmtB family transcription factor [Actinokineospora cianjurensis]|uniref:ArsR family transcriptional regulator n=1 Tax=Actinokineospora cianjurensis TaxID=585224 RepID=A0A421B3U5_9PSEU|nr:metalloregulator ArsR/SmtB family transcription factor [Actinokineospora cianjurensis]RLK59034.1 ArsR family transcriptional regulator [Actinokineospora cianjurensis]
MDEVAGAIADPVRRQILLMLRDGDLAAGDIAGRFEISRPAVSRHLRVLREAGLVSDQVVGRQRVYRLVPAPLTELARWLTGFERTVTWEPRLAALDTEVRRARRDRLAQRDEDTG